MRNNVRRGLPTFAALLAAAAAMIACGSSTANRTAATRAATTSSRLAYMTTEAPSGDLTSVISHFYTAMPGSKPTKIRDYPGQQYYEILASPNGKSLAVTAGGAMVLLSIDGDELVRTGAPAVSFSGAGPFASWSPDSAVFAYTRVDYASQDRSRAGWVETIDVANRKITTTDKLKGAGQAMPSFSPDGKHFAAVTSTTADGDARAIVVTSLDGDFRILTDKPKATMATPLWSPDGKWIAYWIPNGVTGDDGRRIAEEAVYVVPSGGGTPRFVSEAAYLSPQAWSPDGTKLVLACGERSGGPGQSLTGSDICIVGPDGGDAITLTTDHTSFGAAFSADGRSVAYLTDRDKDTGTFTLKVVRLDTREVTTIAKSIAFGGFSWLASP